MFTRSGGVWNQQGSKLVGTGALGFASQGYSVSLSSDGNTAIVGGSNDHSLVGAAWVWVNKGSTGIIDNVILPTKTELLQNYPNPFNPSTTISFSLPTKSFVSLKVFDALGREVDTILNDELSTGSYSRQWNASNMPSGIYFYRLQAGAFTETKKLVLLR